MGDFDEHETGYEPLSPWKEKIYRELRSGATLEEHHQRRASALDALDQHHEHMQQHAMADLSRFIEEHKKSKPKAKNHCAEILEKLIKDQARKKKEDEEMNIWEVAVAWYPTAEQKKAGAKPKIVVDRTIILAANEKAAEFQAARLVPEGDAAESEQLTIKVKPF